MKKLIAIALALALCGCAARQPPAAASLPECPAGPSFRDYAQCRIASVDTLLAEGTSNRYIGVAAPVLVRYRDYLTQVSGWVGSGTITDAAAFELDENTRRRVMADINAAQAMLPPAPVARPVFIPQAPIYTPPRNTTCYPIGRSVNCYSY